MKKIVLLAAITLFGLNSYAQEVSKDSAKMKKNHHKDMQMRDGAKGKMVKGDKEKAPFNKKENKLTAEQRNEIKTKELTLALNLTDKQQQKIIALNKETLKNKPEVKKGEKLTEEQKFQLKNQRLDNQIAYKRSMEKILSKDQFAQWEKMNHKKSRMQHKQMRHSKNMQMAQKAPNKVENNKL